MPNLCSNADCENHLTEFELNRIANRKTKHSKYHYCVKCRRYPQKIISIRCSQCSLLFRDFQTIFQVICKDCVTVNHREAQRKIYYRKKMEALS